MSWLRLPGPRRRRRHPRRRPCAEPPPRPPSPAPRAHAPSLPSPRPACSYVECKTVDFAAFDMQPCWDAPDTNLCTTSCKQNLDRLPQTCVSAPAIYVCCMSPGSA